MQSFPSNFALAVVAGLRRLSWLVQISFSKAFDDSIEFFTIGDSAIGGTDILRGEGDVIQEWDKYAYSEYADRAMSVEWSRTEEPVSSVSLAIADIVLNNHDGYFTPGGGSDISADILPFRPVKLFAGFSDETVPVFVGLTDGMPVVDDSTKQAHFHCVDFLSSLMNRPIDEAVILENISTDQALAELMLLAGISPTQYDFDTGFNIIKVLFFPSGIKLGDAIRQLMIPEMGRFYMDETGILRFKNRQNYSQVPVATYSRSEILDIKTRKQDDIINVVEIFGKIREVVASTDIYRLPTAQLIPAGSSIDIWAKLEDPATTVDDPEYYTTSTGSFFQTNEREDGTGPEVPTGVTLTGSALYGDSFKMTFANAGLSPVYITNLILYGTPAQIDREIYIKESNNTSVAKYDERPLPNAIESEFFPDEATARSKALMMLEDLSEYGAVKELSVKANPALQLGDAIEITAAGYEGIYTVTGNTMALLYPSRLTQRLTVKRMVPREYLTIGESLIGGDDQIAP
jgi:hypothetical protein